jgi:hypothetical protein
MPPIQDVAKLAGFNRKLYAGELERNSGSFTSINMLSYEEERCRKIDGKPRSRTSSECQANCNRHLSISSPRAALNTDHNS